jgi:uncharacterized membrane protein YfcA
VSPRARTIAFGSAALIAVAGGLCGAFVGGIAGLVLAVALLSIGLGGIVLLVFLEIGLSEDKARAREERQRRARSQPPHPPRAAWPVWSKRRPRRPS